MYMYMHVYTYIYIPDYLARRLLPETESPCASAQEELEDDLEKDTKRLGLLLLVLKNPPLFEGP